MARMEFEECHAAGHVKDDPDEWVCTRCDGEQCPVCEQWFVDYDAFTEHVEPDGAAPG